MNELSGRVALITGAGSGIGYETALLLAADGATVVLAGRRRAQLEDTADAVTAAGGVAHVYTADVSVQEEATALVAWAGEVAGPVDILVNNAGSANRVPNLRFTPADDWHTVVETNLDAIFYLSQAVLPGMLASGGGSIITVSSLAVNNPNLLGGAAYGAAKAGATNLMTFLHNTFRLEGIRATSILPGETSTPIMDSRVRPPSEAERANMAQPVDIARAIHLVATLPPRVVVTDLVIAPTKQRDTSSDIETSRWQGAFEGVRPS